MPFPRHESFVTRFRERLSPERGIFGEACPPGIAALPEVAAGIKHHPAGDTDRAAKSALVETMGKEQAAPGEAVEVGGLHFQLAEKRESSMGLVIGEEEEKVGPVKTWSGETIGGGGAGFGCGGSEQD